jgi:hypothetical protein
LGRKKTQRKGWSAKRSGEEYGVTFYANMGCQLSDEDKVILKDLESKKAKLLLDKEREWRLKSRAT